MAENKSTAPQLSRKQQYLKRRESLVSHRQAYWDQDWKDIADCILPRRGRFFTDEANKGNRAKDRQRARINSKATIAARTLRAIMTSGMASPARRWFLGSINDPELKEVQASKDWGYAVEQKVRDVLKKSNLYQCLDNVVGDEGSFGTSVLFVEEDDESVVRGHVFPIGSYAIAANAKGDVTTIFRDVVFTVKQLVDEFGEENCSDQVKASYANRDYEREIEVVHLIEPNADYVPDVAGPKGMRYRSCWFERSVSPTDEKFLREAGFYEQPFMCARWNVTGEDVYGSDCPGMEAIGDAKALQHLSMREEQAFDKSVNPPMVGDTGLIGQRTSTLAGDITYVEPGQQGRFEAALNVGDLARVLERFFTKIAQLEQGVERAYYADLALMFQRIGEGKMTATEVTARQQEQLLLLGPVNERNEKDLLRPLLFRVFMILFRRGELPPPPEQIVGAELKFDFVSIMSQAQKLAGTNNIERLVGMVANIAQVAGEAMDKINLDQAIDEIADALAVPPSVVRSDDEVAKMRQERAAAAQAQQQTETALAAAQGAKALSQADTASDNALTRLMGTPPTAQIPQA